MPESFPLNMAVADSSIYAKGSLLNYWYHGQLTRVEAEHTLTVSGRNCFLIRESRGVLILSLVHRRQLYHIKIEYGPGWYKLQGSSHKCFQELQDLVNCYHKTPISDNPKISLGIACEKTNVTGNGTVVRKLDPRRSADLTGHHWYHGDMSREWAEWILGSRNSNKFLVRLSPTHLVLSMKVSGWMYHSIIRCTPEGYRLEERREIFKTVPEMIAYYRKLPVKKKQVLGTACDRRSLALQVNTISNPERKYIFKKGEYPFRLMWRRCADLPVAISAPQVVRIGDCVYVGGGYRKPGAIKAVFCYNLLRDTWTALPHCPTYQHGLAKLSDELVAIGGILTGPLGEITNKVMTFRDGTWKEVLPLMPTQRCLLSTTSYDNRLIIAAGGIQSIKSNGKPSRTNTVELFIAERQWYTTKSLPFPTYTFSTSIIGNRCYILGGVGAPDESCTTLYATLSSLLENAEPAESGYSTLQCMATWRRLKGRHPLPSSSLVELDGKLVALGGERWSQLSIHGTKFISTYNVPTNTWVECKGAELPVPLYRPGVVKLDNDEVVVVGGETKMQQFVSQVFIGEFLGMFRVYNHCPA